MDGCFKCNDGCDDGSDCEWMDGLDAMMAAGGECVVLVEWLCVWDSGGELCVCASVCECCCLILPTEK